MATAEKAVEKLRKCAYSTSTPSLGSSAACLGLSFTGPFVAFCCTLAFFFFFFFLFLVCHQQTADNKITEPLPIKI